MVNKVNKSTTAQAVEAQVNEATPIADDFDMFKWLRAQADEMGIVVPTGTRVIISLVAGLFVGGASIYMGAQVAAYLTLGAMLLTGSAFISFVMYFIAMGLAIAASFVLGGKMQSFVLSGDIDRTYEKCKSRVLGFFATAKREVAHA